MHIKWFWKILQILEKTSTHFKNKKKNTDTVARSAVLRLAALQPEVKPQIFWKNPQSKKQLGNKLK